MKKFGTLALLIITIGLVIYLQFFKEPEETIVTKTRIEYRDTTIYQDNYEPSYVQSLENSVKSMEQGITRLVNDRCNLTKENSTLRRLLDFSDSTGVIDSMAIADVVFEDYFSKNFYKDTLINDSLMLFVLNDTVSMNRVISRDWEMNRVFPTVIIDNTVYKTPRGLYVGGSLSTDAALGLGASYVHNNSMFTGEYTTNKEIVVGYKHRIGRK